MVCVFEGKIGMIEDVVGVQVCDMKRRKIVELFVIVVYGMEVIDQSEEVIVFGLVGVYGVVYMS